MRSLICIAFLFLAACGGSSGGEMVSRATQAAQLEAQLLNENISDPGQLPDDGVATYAGFMSARLPIGENGSRTRYLGDLSMTVDFSANRNQVSGRARNFENRAGRGLNGTLRLRGGDLFRDTDPDDNYTFTGNVNGTLRRGADRYVIDAGIEGEFRGRRQSGVNGLLFGDITGPQGQDIFDGDFFATQN